MLSFILLAVLTITMPRAATLVIPNSLNSTLIHRDDITYPCPCIDHWVRHGKMWLQASSEDGCMTLESNPDLIWALNKLPKPTYKSHDSPNLICSLRFSRCEWGYSPLDAIHVSTAITTPPAVESSSALDDSDSDAKLSVEQACEEIDDDGLRLGDYLGRADGGKEPEQR